MEIGFYPCLTKPVMRHWGMTQQIKIRTSPRSVSMEQEHLTLADRHVVEGENIVAAQRIIVEQMRRNGGDLKAALSTLVAFEASLKSFYSHRDHILRSREWQKLAPRAPSVCYHAIGCQPLPRSANGPDVISRTPSSERS
jgi:hypothetical protein